MNHQQFFEGLQRVVNSCVMNESTEVQTLGAILCLCCEHMHCSKLHVCNVNIIKFYPHCRVVVEHCDI